MACRLTGVDEAECWCERHRSGDEDEDERRQFVGGAVFQFRGGEALHVFMWSRFDDGLSSICNLREAVKRSELVKLARRGRIPTIRCEQCMRTLRSRTPNARLVRFFQEQRMRAAALRALGRGM